MIKPLFILLNSVTVFIYSFFMGTSPVTITGSFPPKAEINSEFIAEIKIDKGTIAGFAKLQLEVPQGFSVKELESKGGNFSFASNIAKIIWTATPNETDFIVKFTIVADATVRGSKTFKSKFSYVNNNVKEVVEMTPIEVLFSEDSSAKASANEQVETTAVIETPENQSSQSLSAVETTPVTPVSNNNSLNNPTEPISNVVCNRTISKGNIENEINIEVKIKKQGIKGFAKYQEILPVGYTAKQGTTNGSSFSVSDGKAKFVWVSLPLDDELTISYILEKSNSADANAKLDGEFSYIENDQTKKIKLPADFIQANNMATSNSASNVSSNDAATSSVITNPQPSKPATTIVSKENLSDAQTTPVANTIISKKEGIIAYRVQIGAFTNAIASNILTKKFNISETIKSEMAEGFSKFMIGNFNDYKEARTNRESVKQKGCNSAFVVAYNGAKRITVQEALMITSQKWFK